MPPKVVFGWGRRTELGRLAQPLGRRALVVWGSQTLRQSAVGSAMLDDLRAHGIEPCDLTSIRHEPTIEDVDQAAARLRRLLAPEGDFVLAIGGGSALDLGKALAALATNRAGDSVRDYLEGIGRGREISQPPLPVVALPTTAGTGSEATKNAVISCLDPPCKKSLRADAMLPRLVLVDPELTTSVPPAITAHTGLDAITQLIESYISRRAKPIPQALALGALPPALTALPRAVADGGDRQAREALSQAALVSGICLANSGLGMAHGVAAALGVHASLAHGLACAVMLPATLVANRQVAEPRLAELASAVGCQAPSEAGLVDAFIARISDLCRQVGVPQRLSECGVRREQIPALVRDARGNSMSGNPRDLDDRQLTQILEQLW